MIERADQLVLAYVSKVADTAHGVMRADQRLDFVRRLRIKIEELRAGSEDPAVVQRIITRFGDPKVLVERELARLEAESKPDTPDSSRDSSDTSEDDAPTAVFPTIEESPSAKRTQPRGPSLRRVPQTGLARLVGVPDTGRGPSLNRRRPPRSGGRPPGVTAYTQAAEEALARKASPYATPRERAGGDARSILIHHKPELTGIAILVLAALLAPFPLPTVAIFPIPLLFWAAGTVTLLLRDAWPFRDRLIGVLLPMAGYLLGGFVMGVVGRSGGVALDLNAFLSAYQSLGGAMFLVGTAGGVGWLLWRLLKPARPGSPR